MPSVTPTGAAARSGFSHVPVFSSLSSTIPTNNFASSRNKMCFTFNHSHLYATKGDTKGIVGTTATTYRAARKRS